MRLRFLESPSPVETIRYPNGNSAVCIIRQVRTEGRKSLKHVQVTIVVLSFLLRLGVYHIRHLGKLHGDLGNVVGARYASCFDDVCILLNGESGCTKRIGGSTKNIAELQRVKQGVSIPID